MNITDLYQHKHFKNLVRITALGGGWVEFFRNGSLFWLERLIFEQAYTHYEHGDPTIYSQDDIDNLSMLRQLAQIQGELIPHEFNYVDMDA
jgi:hypothetical protein